MNEPQKQIIEKDPNEDLLNEIREMRKNFTSLSVRISEMEKEIEFIFKHAKP
jgi:hypothetical protein